jgi:hypothetical protein
MLQSQLREARNSKELLKNELTAESTAKASLQSQLNAEVEATTALEGGLANIEAALANAQSTSKKIQNERDVATSDLEKLRKDAEKIQKERDARSTELDKLGKDTEKTVGDLRKKLTEAEEKGKRAASDHASNLILLQQATQAHASAKDNVLKLQDCIKEGSTFLDALLNGRHIPPTSSDADTVDFTTSLDETRLRFETLQRQINDAKHEVEQKSSALDEALKAKGDTEAFAIEREQFVNEKDRLQAMNARLEETVTTLKKEVDDCGVMAAVVEIENEELKEKLERQLVLNVAANTATENQRSRKREYKSYIRLRHVLQQSTFIKICKNIDPQNDRIVPSNSEFEYVTVPATRPSGLELRITSLFRPIERRTPQHEIIEIFSMLNQETACNVAYILPKLAKLLSCLGEETVVTLRGLLSVFGEADWRGKTAIVYTVRKYPALLKFLEFDVDIIAEGLTGKYGLRSETAILLRLIGLGFQVPRGLNEYSQFRHLSDLVIHDGEPDHANGIGWALAARLGESRNTHFERLMVNAVERDVIRVERYLNWSEGDGVYVQMDLDAVAAVENEDCFSFGGYSMSPKPSVVW